MITVKLRDYQRKLVEDVRDKILAGYRRILIQLPTGGGKTAIAGYIISQTVKKNNRAMMTAHRSEICSQISETMKKFNVLHGLIQAGEGMDLKHPMQVASILTLRNRINKIPIPAILVVDESQHSISKTWKEVIDFYSEQGTIILGLSATPKRLSGESLKPCFDVMVQGPTIKELIDMGALSQYKYYAPSVGIDTTTIKITCGDYSKTELEIAVNKKKITGDVIAHYKNLIPGKRAIAFCVTVEHAKSVAEQFSANGIPAEFVEGSMSKESRKEVIERFKRGETLVLTNVEIAGEGVDIPAVEAVIMLRPTMSESLYLQQVGRALRIDPNNPDKVAVILDHCANVYTHGLPDAERDWSLEGVSKRKKSEAGTIGIRTCLNCYLCHSPAPVCPYCGYVYNMTARQLAVEAGELKEYDAKIEAEKKKKARMTVGMCRTQFQLTEIAVERGRANGWVYNQCKFKKINFSWSQLYRDLEVIKTGRS